MFPNSDLFSTIFSYDGWLLDFNGTLSDDEALLEECYNDALADISEPLAPGEYLDVCGKSEYDLARILLTRRGLTSLPTQAAFIQRIEELYGDRACAAGTVTPASADLLRRMQERGFPIAVVTGTLRPMITPVLEGSRLGHLLPTVTTAEDVSVGKPAPEGFLRGAGILGVAPERLLAFEDSADGMSAAAAAGMDYVHIGPAPEPGTPTAERSAAAIARFATFDAFAEAAASHLERDATV